MNKNIITNSLLLIGCYIGIWIGIKVTRSGMMQQNLKGYHSVATYETNALSEITIKNIEWKR